MCDRCCEACKINQAMINIFLHLLQSPAAVRVLQLAMWFK